MISFSKNLLLFLYFLFYIFFLATVSELFIFPLVPPPEVYPWTCTTFTGSVQDVEMQNHG